MESAFQPAIKSQSFLRFLISGPSGSGKTYTSLAIATEMLALARAAGYTGKGIAVIDTEHGSASKYADIFVDGKNAALYDVAKLTPPYTPERYIDLIRQAAKAGYYLVVVDSLTHAWTGQGGVLEAVNSSGKSAFQSWAKGTPMHNLLFDSVLAAQVHVIATVRSKEDHVMANGTVTKVGLAPIQRNGIEYEFDVHLKMDMQHNGAIQKTRASALDARNDYNKPGKEIGAILYTWLQGEPVEQQDWELWTEPKDAITWAQESDLLPEGDNARDCLKAVVDTAFDGKLNAGNMSAVFEQFYKTVYARNTTEKVKPGQAADWAALALAKSQPLQPST